MKNYWVFGLVLVVFACDSSSENEVETEDVSEELLDTTAVLMEDTIDVMVELEPIDFADYELLAFGFGDMTGEHILIPDRPKNVAAKEYKYTLDENGKLIEITSEGFQESSENDNMRHSRFNFVNSAGDLFSVNDGKASMWKSIIFLTEDFMEDRVLLEPSKVSYTSLIKEDQSRIEEDKDRKIYRSQLVNSFGQYGELYFAEFEPNIDTLLVSLIWMTESEITYFDMPAKFDEMSSWRVDDGGVFDFDLYQTVGVFLAPSGIELFTNWAGTEGTSINYLVAEEGKFNSVATSYLYQAPD